MSIIAVTGELMLYVAGRSKAMVAAGPKPGRTPIAVPRTAPKKANNTLTGVRATANPLINPEKISIPFAPYENHAPFGRASLRRYTNRTYIAAAHTTAITTVFNHR